MYCHKKKYICVCLTKILACTGVLFLLNTTGVNSHNIRYILSKILCSNVLEYSKNTTMMIMWYQKFSHILHMINDTI